MSEQNAITNAHNFQDLTGRSYERLTILKRDPRTKRKVAFWICRCECGVECVASAYALTSGAKTDCGCQRGNKQKEAMRLFHQQHLQPTAVAIELTNGMAAIVDENDYNLVSQYWWSSHKGARTTYARAGTGVARILMHSLLMGKKDGYTVDHINGNGLDNRRCNLRFATGSQQSRNLHIGRGRSLFKGVCWANRQRKWAASISFNGSNKHIGYFEKEEDAARAYDEAAKAYFGEFACLNFGGGNSYVS